MYVYLNLILPLSKKLFQIPTSKGFWKQSEYDISLLPSCDGWKLGKLHLSAYSKKVVIY